MNQPETNAEADSLATTASAACEETESVRRKKSTADCDSPTVVSSPRPIGWQNWVARGRAANLIACCALHMSRFEVPQ